MQVMLANGVSSLQLKIRDFLELYILKNQADNSLAFFEFFYPYLYLDIL